MQRTTRLCVLFTVFTVVLCLVDASTAFKQSRSGHEIRASSSSSQDEGQHGGLPSSSLSVQHGVDYDFGIHHQRHRGGSGGGGEQNNDSSHSEEAEDEEEEDDDDAAAAAVVTEDPCDVKYCGRGRECQVGRDGVAQCVCQRHCKKHRKLVCGSDGNLYLNHCELHRAACLVGKPLTIDRKNACLRKKDFEYILDNSGSTVNARVERVDRTGSPWSIVRETLESAAAIVATATATASVATSSATKTPSTASLTTTDHPPVVVVMVNKDVGIKGSLCSVQEYEILKDNLLLFNHAKLVDTDDTVAGKRKKNEDKEYLVSVMFSHYDQNNNGVLERDELKSVSEAEHLDRLIAAGRCQLSDLVAYDDANSDGRLDINEFYAAFSKLYSVSLVSLDKALETNHVIAHVGDNVEIKCDVTGTPLPPIVWRRNDVDLAALGSANVAAAAASSSQDDVKVFVDGTLYLTRVQLVHAGNYTCHAQRNRDVVQTHVLHVETMPQVRVTPKIQSRKPGEEAAIECRANGVPLPTVQWLKNDEDLKMISQKYNIVGNGTSLGVRKITYSDTGAYMCVASNTAGTVRDISSLVVQDDPTPSKTQWLNAAPTEELRFFVFHDWGVSVYEPTTCRLYHQIQGTDIIPGTQEYVCGDKGVNCSWGRAITVADRYVYASQPNKDRILVISQMQMVVVDVVVTDKYPVELHHVPHLDQVWLLCWRSAGGGGAKTIQIVRDASQKRKHHTVHPEPVDGHFDLVADLFVPDAQTTGHKFRHAYAVHTNQRGMYKVDLAAIRYVRTVDLTPYNCVPQNVAFSSVGGLVVIECAEPITNRPTGQILLDYMTDSVLAHKPHLFGTPLVSPDSLHVVTIERRNGSVTIIAQETSENAGLRFVFDVKTTLNVSDLTFYQSRVSHSYDLYASAVDKEDLLFVNLADGKVEMITGVGRAMSPEIAEWSNVNRPITSSGPLFGSYMVTPAREALFVVNGRTHTVNCEIGSLVNPRLIVWVVAAL